MEICLESHDELNQRPSLSDTIGDVSISDIRGAISSETDWSQTLDYFYAR